MAKISISVLAGRSIGPTAYPAPPPSGLEISGKRLKALSFSGSQIQERSMMGSPKVSIGGEGKAALILAGWKNNKKAPRWGLSDVAEAQR
jgi:hypothetical protein